jgi:ornithine carbamoyltransferase
MATKHFLSLKYLSKKEILDIISLSLEIKKKFKKNIPTRVFENKTLGLIFNKPSTRTRVSFEVASFQLGGNSTFLSKSDLQLGRGESIEDTAKVLSTMIDIIGIRTNSQEEIESYAKYSTVPVINALSDISHPTQMMADFMTIKEHNKDNGKICFIGDGNNMMNSWLFLASILGLELSIATPKQYQISEDIIREAKKLPLFDENKIKFFNDPSLAIKDASVVMTDTWVSMDQEHEKITSFKGFTIDDKMMSLAKKDAIFLHCLPAYREHEVSASVIDGKQSVVFEQTENKLHANKGLLAWLVS